MAQFQKSNCKLIILEVGDYYLPMCACIALTAMTPMLLKAKQNDIFCPKILGQRCQLDLTRRKAPKVSITITGTRFIIFSLLLS